MALIMPQATYANVYDGSSGLLGNVALPQPLNESELQERHFALYQGSGGVVADFFIAPSGSSQIQVYTAPSSRLESVVSEICLAFGLTKEELAQICKVQSMKTLYNWINGEVEPRRATMNRIYDLLMVARAWLSSGFIVDREQLYQPVIDGQSLFELLSQEQINKDLVLFAGTRLNMLSMAKGSLSDPFV